MTPSRSLLLALALLPIACVGELEDEEDEAPQGGGEFDAMLPTSCEGDNSSTGAVRGDVRRIAALGDSIMAYNREQNASAPDVAAGVLGVPLTNWATGGAELGGEDGIPTLYESGDFSHVFVNGGGNDFARECDDRTLDGLISPDLSSGLMVDLVDRIGRDGGQSVIMGYYLPSDRDVGCPLFPELLQRYRALGQTRDDVMYVCTLDTITPEQSELYADPVHPSVAGSRALGELLARVLQPS